MKSLRDIGEASLFYVDTNIFLNVIYKETGFYDGSRKFLELIQRGSFKAFTSSVTLLEVKLDMARSGCGDVADKALGLIEDVKNLEVTSLDRVMVKMAGDYVLRDGLTVHDAYHLATALCGKADGFISRDEELKGKIARHVHVKDPEDVK